MTPNNSEQMSEIKQKLAAIYKAERSLVIAEKRLTEEKQRLAELFKVMSKEEQDVKKLESFSLKALYHDLFGDKEQQLNQEQTEFFAAKLKYDSCLSQVNSIKNEIVSYHQLIKEKSSLEAEFKRLLSAFSTATNSNQQFLDITAAADTTKTCLRELREARAAGQDALDSTQKALNLMKSASNWGIFDMVGGGLIATAVKHSKVGSAQREMENLRNHLDRFQRELQDVNQIEYSGIEIHIGTFASVADFVLDGLIFDWIVQSKINRCKDKLIAVDHEIKVMLSHLNKLIQESKKQLENQQHEWQHLLNREAS